MFSLTLWPGVALGGGREDGRSSPVPFRGDLAGPPDCGPVSGGHGGCHSAGCDGSYRDGHCVCLGKVNKAQLQQGGMRRAFKDQKIK